MHISFGSEMAGKVDRIERVGYVCTRFFHINHFPLLPLDSRFVAEGTPEADGIRLPLSWKSALLGWFRGTGVYGSFAWVVGIVIGVTDEKPLLAALCTAGLALTLLALVASYYLPHVSRASYERAVEIGRQVNFHPETLLLLEVAYGRLTADEAEAELARLIELEQLELDRSEASAQDVSY